jgi:hypothetical protein
MLYDVNIEKEKILIINELLLGITSLVNDHTFGYLKSLNYTFVKPGKVNIPLKNNTVDEQCLFLKDTLDKIHRMLHKYNITSYENVEERQNKFLQKNLITSEYSNCISNFWYGTNDIGHIDSHLNMVMGHLWQYMVMTRDGIVPSCSEDKLINIPINDKRLTKLITSSNTFIEYGLIDKPYPVANIDSYSGMTSNCSMETDYSRLYRLDVAVSRSFNDLIANNEKFKNHDNITLENQSYRFPQALHIIYTGDTYEVFFRRTHENIMKIHMNNLSEPNIKDNEIKFKQKYIKYMRKIHDLTYNIPKYSVYKK